MTYADSGRLITTSNSGTAVRVFGLIFMSFGLIFTSLILFGPGGKSDSLGSRLLGAAFGSVFVLIGAGIAGWRSTTVIDPRRRTITTRSGWMAWTRTRTLDIGDWVCVQAGPEESRGSGNNRYKAVPVSIMGSGGRCEVGAPRTSLPAMQIAERFAIATTLPLRDATEGTAVERSVESLTAPIPVPEQPAALPGGSDIRIDDAVRGVCIRIPPLPRPLVRLAGALLIRSLVMVPFLIFWHFLWVPSDVRAKHPSPIFLVFSFAPLAMGAIIVAIAWVRVLRSGRYATATIMVDADAIRCGWTRIPSKDLHDLRIVGTGEQAALLMRSSTVILHVGWGRSAAELAFVRDALLRATNSL